MTELLPFFQIIIFSLSNCRICDDQVVIFAGNGAFGEPYMENIYTCV